MQTQAADAVKYLADYRPYSHLIDGVRLTGLVG